MSNLANQLCKSCNKSEVPLTREQAEHYLAQMNQEWTLSENGKSISRSYSFNNYYETIAFVNVAAMVAHQQDHHPEMTVAYNRCRIEYSTHSIGGLSVNDFICAAKIDQTLSL